MYRKWRVNNTFRILWITIPKVVLHSAKTYNYLDFTEYLLLCTDKADTTNGILYRFTGVGGHIKVICFETEHSAPLSKRNNYFFHYVSGTYGTITCYVIK